MALSSKRRESVRVPTHSRTKCEVLASLQGARDRPTIGHRPCGEYKDTSRRNVRTARSLRSTRLNACFAYCSRRRCRGHGHRFQSSPFYGLRARHRRWSRSRRRSTSWCSRSRSGRCSRRRNGRCWGRTLAAAYKVELTDARSPAARIILIGMPEGHAIGRVDSGHAVVAPPVSRLGADAVKHDGFTLAQIIWRIGLKTPCVPNAWDGCRLSRLDVA